MKITFVGTSHGVPEHDRFCTAMFLEVGDSCYIIDAGAPVSSMLKRYGIPYESVKGVFITHLHGDHFDGLFEFADQLGWRYLNCHPRILLPEEKGVALLSGFLKTMSTTKRELDILSYTEGEIYKDENIRVTAIPTDHSNLVSFAFKIEAEGKKILFTGDMHAELTEFSALFENESYELVVFEGAHTRLLEKVQRLASVNTSKMIINHIYSVRNSAEDMTELKKILPFELVTAEDGMIIEILNNCTTYKCIEQ